MKTSNQLLRLSFLSISILLLAVTPERLFSQGSFGNSADSTKYFLAGKLGINDFHAKDEYLSPGIYRGKLFSADVSFTAKSKEFTHEAELTFSTGKPELAGEAQDIYQKTASLSYALFYNVKTFNVNGSPLKLNLGAGVSSFVMNSDFVLNSKYGLGEYIDQAWYWSHSLNVFARGEYLIAEKHEAAFQIGMPVLRLVSRPDNGHWTSDKNQEVINNSFFNAATGGKIEFFTEKLVLNCLLEYKYKLNETTKLCGSYGFNFITSNKPLPMKTYMNVVLIGLETEL